MPSIIEEPTRSYQISPLPLCNTLQQHTLPPPPDDLISQYFPNTTFLLAGMVTQKRASFHQPLFFLNFFSERSNRVVKHCQGWRMVKSKTRRDAEILVRNPSPRLFGEKFRDSKKVKYKPWENETSRLIKNVSEISRSCQNSPRLAFFEVPFAIPTVYSSL